VTIIPVPAGLHPRPSVPSKPVTGRYGIPIPLEVFGEGVRYVIRRLEEVKPEEFDAIVIPGGFSPDHLRVRREVLEFVRRAHEAGKIIAAICHGPQVLISAGLVRGRRVTAYEAIKDDLINAGAVFVDEPAVRDGNIITGRVPDDLPEFCRLIVEALS
jgi:protease I